MEPVKHAQQRPQGRGGAGGRGRGGAGRGGAGRGGAAGPSVGKKRPAPDGSAPAARKLRPTSLDDVVMNQSAQGRQNQAKGKAGRHGLTLSELSNDKLAKIAAENWSSDAQKAEPPVPFKPELVVSIYNDELGGTSDKPPALARIKPLEVTQYLESYLWPNYDPATATFEHVMSIILFVNQKFRDTIPAWDCFQTRKDVFAEFFKAFLHLKQPGAMSSSAARPMRMHERTTCLVFTINVFQSLENEMVRPLVLKLVSLPLWRALSPGRLQLELHAQPQLAKHWKVLLKKEAKASKQAGYVGPLQRPETQFMPGLLDEFLETLDAVLVAPTPAEPAPAADDSAAASGANGAGAEAGSAQPAAPAAAAAPAGGTMRAAAGVPGELVVDARAVAYCERFLELLIDLLSQLPTRRFTRTLLDDRAILVKIKLAPLFKRPDAALYCQLVDLLQSYLAFPINDHTGDPISDDDLTAAHYEKVCQLQRLAFKHWPQLQELAMSNCGTAERRDYLRRALALLSPAELRKLVVQQLRLVSEHDAWSHDKTFLMEVMLATYERRRTQREVINEMPLYPTEGLLWDENQVPSITTNEGCLALPKLNLQFLTPHDYLLRNFHLFRLEATYEIREDVGDVISRVGAYWDDSGDQPKVRFGGWARMALELQTFTITEIKKPSVGETKSAGVTAKIVIDTRPLAGHIRSEWDELRQHDVLFLMTLRPPSAAELAATQQGERTVNAAEQYGLVYVRGCEVIEVADEAGKLMNDSTGRVRRDEVKPPEGTVRTLTVALDTAQYQMDMNWLQKNKGAEDPYSTFNLLMRRKPKENNFKAVLESIRDLMNEEVIIPPWLHDIFLGYGDPGAAQWTQLPEEQRLRTVDFKDTFLDAEHLQASFPQHSVTFKPAPGQPGPVPPFRITFPSDHDTTAAAGAPAVPSSNGTAPAASAPESAQSAAEGGTAPAPSVSQPASGQGLDPAPAAPAPGGKKVLLVEGYVPPDPGPYPQDAPRMNSVRFTPVQVDAIMSGVQPGLTMVVGPPGTGKTDTAVQIMHVLYHNCPAQRTLVIAHSNQALNDLFQKIIERDVPARYLLRLGMGEQELDTAEDFSRTGRVNAMLARRLELLASVERMARQFGVVEDISYTCETAGYFWLMHVLSRWEKFLAQVEKARTCEAVATLFPFKEFFSDAPQPLFKGRTYEQDMERARGCLRHLRTMFQELEECRAFELLRGQADRVSYLMTKHAKIVAMTCTHAALKRKEFVEMAFKYDNLLMEESGQILEIETFIPMLLQRQEDGVSRLKRVVLIGDHHQLPPVVQNMAIQKYSHLDQPLFTRFIRLGTPYVELDAQGRARPSIAKLYNWRYRALGNLESVTQRPEYQTANPGFAFDWQFINVPDFLGKGESQPHPYFYQNLGEAEYVVSIFAFMRLMGYPAHKITILTTYNGQKNLIRDVVERRCAGHPLLGMPFKIATVDKYQGQQNDYVLLSLVRTMTFGHLRDVRRLIVAMSRARLGLYIVGRQDLFKDCYELKPTFSQLLARPTKLALVKGEGYGTCTRKLGDKVKYDLVPGVEAMAQLVTRVTEEQVGYAAMEAMAAAAEQHVYLTEQARLAEEAAEAAAQAGTAGADEAAAAAAGPEAMDADVAAPAAGDAAAAAGEVVAAPAGEEAAAQAATAVADPVPGDAGETAAVAGPGEACEALQGYVGLRRV